MFIEYVAKEAAGSAFPMDRKNALTLIQLTLGMLEKVRDKQGGKRVFDILRKNGGDGRADEEGTELTW
jgi:hypothetical protein